MHLSHERQNKKQHYDRSRDRYRNCDSRDITPNRSSERKNSRESSRGQSPRVHFVNGTQGGYYVDKNKNEIFLNQIRLRQ